jgi:hypothetical protein
VSPSHSVGTPRARFKAGTRVGWDMGLSGNDLTRMSPMQRRALQIVGLVFIALGIVLIVGAILTTVRPSGDLLAPGGFEGQASRMVGGFLVVMMGMIVAFLGAVMVKFGFLKPVSEIVATETAGAVEHASGALGRGLAGAGIGTGRHQIKVRCRACGFLDTEDARFCSGCGKPM